MASKGLNLPGHPIVGSIVGIWYNYAELKTPATLAVLRAHYKHNAVNFKTNVTYEPGEGDIDTAIYSSIKRFLI